MHLIIGLGNPGESYANNRHNIGFLALDVIQKKLGVPKFQLEKKFPAWVTFATFQGEKIILAKPNTFMNESGKAATKLLRYYKISHENMLLIHDDSDLNFHTLKISHNRGSAGHHGVESVIEHIKSKTFIRLRLGIGSPERKRKSGDIVLKNFSTHEKKSLQEFLEQASNATLHILEHGASSAMNTFH